MKQDRYPIEERFVRGKRLGRHVNFDPRSADYPVTPLLESTKVEQRYWGRPGAFDQGDTGSCTGQAVAGLAMAAPIATPDIDVGSAIAIYEQATKIDTYAGVYPPVDGGSSVLAAMKAAVLLDKLKGYRWCFSLADVLQALSQVGSVAIGIKWYDSFDEPDANGLLHLTAQATVRGGHAVNLTGVDPKDKLVVGWNSWGETWGAHGQFLMDWDTLERLLADDGEAAVGQA
jgi:hypothetical protein